MPDQDVSAVSRLMVARQLKTDQQLVNYWLDGMALSTRRAYRADTERLVAFVRKPLRDVTLSDLQSFAAAHAYQAPTSMARRLSSVRSLLAFGQRVGYLASNAGAELKLQNARSAPDRRIVSEDEFQRMLALEPEVDGRVLADLRSLGQLAQRPPLGWVLSLRNRVLLRLVYVVGLRPAEVGELKWRDLKPNRFGAGEITISNSRGKIRNLLLPPDVWRELTILREIIELTGWLNDGDSSDPVFGSKVYSRETHRRGTSVGDNYLSQSQVWRIVSTAAQRAGLRGTISPSCLRRARSVVPESKRQTVGVEITAVL